MGSENGTAGLLPQLSRCSPNLHGVQMNMNVSSSELRALSSKSEGLHVAASLKAARIERCISAFNTVGRTTNRHQYAKARIQKDRNTRWRKLLQGVRVTSDSIA